jgi:signal transduction histidine kinase
MAAINYEKGRLEESKRYFKSTIAIRLSLRDYEGAVNTYLELANAYEISGDLDSAFIQIYDALKWQKQTSNDLLLAKIYLRAGYLARLAGKSTKEVLHFYEQAHQIAEATNDASLRIEWNNELGSYYADQEQFDKALTYHLRVADLLATNSDSVMAISNFNNLAVCYVALQAYEVAHTYYQKQLQWSYNLSLLGQAALAQQNMGVLFFKQAQFDSANHYLLESLATYQTLLDQQGQAKVYEKLAATAAELKDYEQALAYHITYTQLSKEILNAERQKAIEELQVKYDTEQKDLALQVAQEEEKAQKAQKNLFIAGSIVLALLLGIGVLIYLQKQRVNAQNSLLQEQKLQNVLDTQELKTYEAMMQGQEEERMRIAADLHDRLGSMLSTVKLLFSGLEDKLDQQQEANQQQYNQAKFIIDDACTEIRRISHNLGAGMVANFGLSNAIGELCSSLNYSETIQCEFSAHQIPENIPLKVETEIYRMVQEAMNNVIKHAQATTLHIQLNGREKELNLIIDDNGVGFDPEATNAQRGMGLQSIRNRVKLLGGTLHIDSVLGRGTTFIIDFPVNWTND